jgi:hypothetical protein
LASSFFFNIVIALSSVLPGGFVYALEILAC